MLSISLEPAFTVELTPSSPCSLWSPLSRQGAAPACRSARLDSLPPHDQVIWTDGSVPFAFGKGGSGVFVNCSLCGTETTLSCSAGPVCSFFFAEACAILQALCWSRQHQQVCHFSSFLLSGSRSVFVIVLSSVFPFISIFLADLEGLSSLSSYTARLQWVPEHSFLPWNVVADELARRGALLVPSAIPRSFFPFSSRIHSFLLSDWRRTVSSKFFNTQVPSISTKELVLCRLRCNGHSLLLSSYLYDWQNWESLMQRLRTFVLGHLSSHCAQHYGLFAPLTFWRLSLYELWSRPWKVAPLLGQHGFTRHGPIPRKGSGNTNNKTKEDTADVTG